MAITTSGTSITFNDSSVQSTAGKWLRYSSGTFSGTSVTLLNAVAYNNASMYVINIAMRSGGSSMTQTLSASSSPSFQAQYNEQNGPNSWNGNGTSTTGGYIGFCYTNDSSGNLPGANGQIRVLTPPYNSNVGLSYVVMHEFYENSSLTSFGNANRTIGQTRPMTGLGQGTSQTFTYGFTFSATTNGTYDIFYMPA